MEQKTQLQQMAIRLAQICEATTQKIVFAESCTCGLVAAAMAGVPGISRFLCGSMVTYRESAKTIWLGIEPEMLEEHSAVSQEVTEKMAMGVLASVPESDWSAAVTGHLGPNSPYGLDGRIYIAFARRSTTEELIHCQAHQLVSESRLARQEEAACQVLETMSDAMDQN